MKKQRKPKLAKKPRKSKKYRSAKSGRYVTRDRARRCPDTTVGETD